MTRIVAGTYTVCMDTNKTDEDSYANWLTVKLVRNANGDYHVFRLTNRDGNGQAYNRVGRIVDGALWIQGLDVTTVCCASILARKWDLTYNRITRVKFPNSRVFRPRTRKTSAPSLLRDTRDKNRNNMREHVGRIDMTKAMAGR